MQNQSLKLRILNFKFWFLLFGFSFSVILCWCSYGCSIWRYFRPEVLSYEKLSASYRLIRLASSSKYDVLRMIHSPQFDLGPNFRGTRLLSQSDTVVASVGRSYDGYKSFFTMISFDESDMTANRKYFYLMDERALLKPTGLRNFQILPKPGLIFDSQMVLQLEVLAKPYATQHARQIAILKHIAENISYDIDKLSKDNQTLAVSGMLMNQVFKAVLLELEKSPVLAKNLSDESGVVFNHISLGKGQISMTIEDNIATIKIRLGIFRDL